jgi:hypothetical protein
MRGLLLFLVGNLIFPRQASIISSCKVSPVVAAFPVRASDGDLTLSFRLKIQVIRKPATQPLTVAGFLFLFEEKWLKLLRLVKPR